MIRNLDVTVAGGEGSRSVLASNGAGKTTTLRVIFGIVKPMRGPSCSTASISAPCRERARSARHRSRPRAEVSLRPHRAEPSARANRGERLDEVAYAYFPILARDADAAHRPAVGR